MDVPDYIDEAALREAVESHRAAWAEIAKANGWYTEPFHVQVWLTPEGFVADSVATRESERDYIIDAWGDIVDLDRGPEYPCDHTAGLPCPRHTP